MSEEDIAALIAANPDSAALSSLVANYQAAQTVKAVWEQTKAGLRRGGAEPAHLLGLDNQDLRVA